MSLHTPATSESAAVRTTPIITLKNDITIRPYRPSDVAAIVHHGNNRKIWLNLTERFPHPYTESSAEYWIESCTNPDTYLKSHNGNAVPANYVICLSDSPIGSIGLESVPKAPHCMNLGYWLGEEYWGKGIVSMAAAAFLKWSFDTFPWLIRMSSDAYSWNAGSMRVLQKIGMQIEGTRKLEAFKDGRYGDSVLFGIVRPDFAGRVVGKYWEEET